VRGTTNKLIDEAFGFNISTCQQNTHEISNNLLHVNFVLIVQFDQEYKFIEQDSQRLRQGVAAMCKC